MKLRGKKALITGGTGELGKAVTRHFLDEGSDVAVTCRSDKEGENFAKLFPGVLLLKGDLSSSDDVRRIFQVFRDEKGTVDILCNLAGGYMAKKTLSDLTEAEWDFMLTLNLKTCFLCSQHALRIMHEKKYGRIVNVSAMAGLLPSAGRGAYGISKSAIATLTRIAAEEAKAIPDSDVTVNAIAPSILLTEPNARSATTQETRSWVTLEQAAHVIGFLASDEAAAINGETIKVYGRI